MRTGATDATPERWNAAEHFERELRLARQTERQSAATRVEVNVECPVEENPLLSHGRADMGADDAATEEASSAEDLGSSLGVNDEMAAAPATASEPAVESVATAARVQTDAMATATTRAVAPTSRIYSGVPIVAKGAKVLAKARQDGAANFCAIISKE